MFCLRYSLGDFDYWGVTAGAVSNTMWARMQMGFSSGDTVVLCDLNFVSVSPIFLVDTACLFLFDEKCTAVGSPTANRQQRIIAGTPQHRDAFEETLWGQPISSTQIPFRVSMAHGVRCNSSFRNDYVEFNDVFSRRSDDFQHSYFVGSSDHCGPNAFSPQET